MLFGRDIVTEFKEGNILNRLILINLGVFVVIIFFLLTSTLFGLEKDWIYDLFALPGNMSRLLSKPWTVLTYMFVHVRFFHLIFNLIALYWFGKMFMNWIGQSRLLSVYLLGGISGAIAYLIAYQLFPGLVLYNQIALVVGASGSIYAIMLAVGTMVPRHKIMIPLIAQFELRQLVMIFIGIDVLSIAFSQNVGGHFAHIGGALFGYIFGIFFRKGFDITYWLSRFIEFLTTLFSFSKKPKYSFQKPNQARYESDMEYNARKENERKEVNRILDKIAESGYESLTKREKEILFKSSKNK
jgi:membrane associated rhomboid family serine protease